MPICGPLLGPTVALALIEISPTLLQSPLQGLSRLLPARTSPLPPPGLSFSHRYLSWLAPPITPHPRAELKEPAAVACARTCIGNSPLTTAKAVRKRWVLLPAMKQGIRGTLPNILLTGQMYRLGSLLPLAVSYSIGTPLRCITECGVMLIGSNVLKNTKDSSV